MTTYAAYPNADGYWRSDAVFDTTGTAWVAGYTGTRGYGAFFRFTSVTIPAGATIDACTMDFTTTVGAGTPDIRMSFEAADNPAFPTSKADAEGRTVTTAYGNYTTAWPGTGRRTTPSMAASLQEVVDRGGWASGNAIQNHWRDFKATGSNYIQGYTIERTGTTGDPYLTVDYTEAAAGTGNLLLLGVG
jgi:hypothetical protein